MRNGCLCLSDPLIHVVDKMLMVLSIYQVHMEAERKAMPEDADILPQEKITYKVGTKVSFP